MPQADPAANAGTAGSPQIGTGGVAHDHHDQMHHAEQGDRKHQAEAIALDGQQANLPSTPTATSLHMAVPEAHPALQLQQHEQGSSAPLPPHSSTASHDAAAVDRGGVCTTLTTIEPDSVGSTTAVEHKVVAPPPHLEKIVPPSPAATTTLPIPNTNTSPTAAVPAHATDERPHHLRASLSHLLPHHHTPNDASTHTSGGPHEGKMLFGKGSGAGSAAHRKKAMANTNAITAYEADLTSKDRATQKEAVRRFLNDAVKTDWQWEWPRPEGEATPDDTHAEEPDDLEWRERDEWLSNVSDSEAEPNTPASKTAPISPTVEKSPFRFDSPDGVGDSIMKTERDRKRRRKRRLKEEMEWNNGLRCFVERRDAWTGARHVTPAVARAPSPPKRMSFSSGDGGSSTAVEPEEPEDEWEDDDMQIPIAPPLIPPENPMRASIKPDVYNTIYDKVIIQQLTPSCPMNLKDVTRSCVQGWKRDGEWPPKPGPESPKTKKRRMSVAALFSTNSRENVPKEKTKENEPANEEKKEKAGGRGTIRKSFQKILTFGHANGSKTKDDNPVTAA